MYKFKSLYNEKLTVASEENWHDWCQTIKAGQAPLETQINILNLGF